MLFSDLARFEKVREAGNNSIRVSSVSPRLVRTEFAHGLFPDRSEAKAAQVYESASPCLAARDVAESILHVLEAPEGVQIQDVHISPVGCAFK